MPPVVEATSTPPVFNDISDYNTHIYDRNIERNNVCLASASIEFGQVAEDEDLLAKEWSRVRKQPNLRSCYEVENTNACNDF